MRTCLFVCSCCEEKRQEEGAAEHATDSRKIVPPSNRSSSTRLVQQVRSSAWIEKTVYRCRCRTHVCMRVRGIVGTREQGEEGGDFFPETRSLVRGLSVCVSMREAGMRERDSLTPLRLCLSCMLCATCSLLTGDDERQRVASGVPRANAANSRRRQEANEQSRQQTSNKGREP